MHIKHSLFPRVDSDGVPTSPATAEEFSGWLQRVWLGEWVAPIGFNQNPLEKKPFEAQIAAARPKSYTGQFGLWLVSSSTKKIT